MASGWLSPYNGLVHPVGATHTITGNKVNCIDTVFSGMKSPPPPYAAGDFLWAIPWRYKTGPLSGWSNFFTANHHATSNDSGQALIEKAGAGPYTRKPADPTSGYSFLADREDVAA